MGTLKTSAGVTTGASEMHRGGRIGWLRAAVLGANDGIVSTASLVIGVAAADATRSAVLVAGVAGLAAGALSMAAGEYVSVSSQADTERADLEVERLEQVRDADLEMRELAQIYVGRGVEPGLALQVAQQLMARDALGAHARDELGFSATSQPRPLQVALASAAAFAAGAAVPLLTTAAAPTGRLALVVASASLVCLAGLGSLAAWAGRNEQGGAAMWWVPMWVVVTVVGVCGVVASANAVRFERRVAREVREMQRGTEATFLDRGLAGLPNPARHYLDKALGSRQRAVQTVHLQHGGTFRTSLDGKWLAIRGGQHFTTDPPGFIWWGRVRLFPGIWVDARDRSVNGIGNMFVTMESSFTIADSSGAEMDQGSLVRLLCEIPWFPTAFLDGRYVQWSAVDEHNARATLQVNVRSVTASFEFGPDDLPTTCTADGFFDGGGVSVLTPWVGQFTDFRAVDGVLVPHHVVAACVVNGNPSEYVRFDVERVVFDGGGPS
jgi:vacuolar iron transporter family protein